MVRDLHWDACVGMVAAAGTAAAVLTCVGEEGMLEEAGNQRPRPLFLSHFEQGKCRGALGVLRPQLAGPGHRSLASPLLPS